LNALARSSIAVALLALGGVGCGAQFDPGSQLDGLRVLAVQKSTPYAKPGTQVDLQLLWNDTDTRPPPQIAWLALCENPPGDLFTGCLGQIGAAFGSANAQGSAPGGSALGSSLAGRVSLPEAAAATANDRFSFAVSADVISSRPAPKDPSVTPYGIDYVLFAACAGTLTLGNDPSFPFICYLESDGEPGFSAGDVQLGSRDFVLGYSEVFAYEELQNHNPALSGLEFNGLHLEPSAVPSSVEDGAPLDAPALGPDDLCIADACTPADPAADPSVCPDALALEACGDHCETLTFGAVIDPTNAEVDEAASRGRPSVLSEQMWVNYYSAGGKVSDEVRLLNDATLGWNSDHATKYRPPKDPGVAYLWAIAHDNRGGVGWARLRVCAR
jgi:hypothetical protein